MEAWQQLLRILSRETLVMFNAGGKKVDNASKLTSHVQMMSPFIAYFNCKKIKNSIHLKLKHYTYLLVFAQKMQACMYMHSIITSLVTEGQQQQQQLLYSTTAASMYTCIY